jgi:hypothetical protein
MGEGMAIQNRPYGHVAIECEARRICDERGITDWDSFVKICAALRHREFMQAIEPYLKLKTRLYNSRHLERIVIEREGAIPRYEYKQFSPEVESALAHIDEMIDREALRWGVRSASNLFASSSAWAMVRFSSSERSTGVY